MMFHLRRTSYVLIAAFVSMAFASPAWAAQDDSLHLIERSRTEITPHSGQYQVAEKHLDLDPKQTALIICDLWDKHWCDGARTCELASWRRGLTPLPRRFGRRDV